MSLFGNYLTISCPESPDTVTKLSRKLLHSCVGLHMLSSGQPNHATQSYCVAGQPNQATLWPAQVTRFLPGISASCRAWHRPAGWVWMGRGPSQLVADPCRLTTDHHVGWPLHSSRVSAFNWTLQLSRQGLKQHPLTLNLCQQVKKRRNIY